MSQPDHDNTPFPDLLAGVFDGTLNDAQWERFRTLVKNNPAARDQYVNYALTHSLLDEELRGSSEIGTPAEAVDSAISRSVFLDAWEQEQVAIQRRAVEKAEEEERKRSEEKLKQESLARLMGTTKIDPGPQTRHYVIPRPLFYGSIAAAVAVLAVIILPLFDSKNPESPIMVPDDPAATRFQVATVVDQVGAKWEDAPNLIRRDEIIYNEPRKLASGIIKLRFDGGAEVIIEAPASIVPTADDQMKIVRGKVVGHCPTVESRGFVMLAPNAKITDLGTEFAVEVDENGDTETHVFTGVVDLAPIGESGNTDGGETLKAGAARRVDREGSTVEKIEVNEFTFVRDEEFVVRTKARDGSAYHQWLAQSYELRRHPGMVVHYVIDDADEAAGRLINRAARTFGEMDGVLGIDTGGRVEMPLFREGRWDEDRSLQMGFTDRDHPRAVTIPHHPALNMSKELTLSVWFKRGDDGLSGGTLLCKREGPIYVDQPGENRRMAFQYSAFMEDEIRPNKFQFGSGVEIENERSDFVYSREKLIIRNRWNLATVTVRNGQNVTFYLNGKQISRHVLQEPLAQNESDVLIGVDPLHHHPDGGTSREVFFGHISELMIMDQALSEQEIKMLYDIGRKR